MSETTSAASPAGWCLRFVGGPMRGRTIALKPGRNLIGSAGGCDLMLPGPDVQPRHLEFTVGEVAVAMERHDNAAVQLNGAEVTAARRGVVAGDRISIARIEFEIDRVYANEEAGDAMFLDPAAAREPQAQAPETAPARRMARAWPVFATAFAVSVMVLWWALASPADATARPADDLARLKLALASYPEVDLVAASGGQMEAKGYVESEHRRLALEQALKPYAGRVTLRVQAVDSMIDQARRFVGDPGVAVSYDGKGRLLFTGASESTAVRDKIARLAEDLHPARVNDKVQYKPVARAEGADKNALWSNWQSLLPARVVSITEGADGHRHIQLANGHRYYEGALLKSGAQLKLVTPDELVIAPEAAP